MCKVAYKETALDLAMELFQEGKEKGYTEEILAEKIGCSPYSIQDYRYGRSAPSLAVFIGGWIAIKPINTLKTLAKWSNCIVIPVPQVDEKSHLAIMSKKLASSLQEFSEYVDTVGNSLADNRITQSEAQKIEKEGYEAIEKILELIETARRLAK